MPDNDTSNNNTNDGYNATVYMTVKQINIPITSEAQFLQEHGILTTTQDVVMTSLGSMTIQEAFETYPHSATIDASMRICLGTDSPQSSYSLST